MSIKRKYRQPKGASLFETENTNIALSSMGNPLVQLNDLIDFEMFRQTLESLIFTKEHKAMSGRRRIDIAMMFKILFLQRLYNLSDHQTQYQLTDILSFREFIGIESVDDIPDEKTIWLYREELAKSGAFDKMFELFRKFLSDKGLIFKEGKIIDAPFMDAPRQRNTRDENRRIKNGERRELWPAEPNKQSHKDVDAAWGIKRKEKHFGYKAHAKVDAKSKFVDAYETTPANMHDSRVLTPLIRDEDKGQKLYLDAGYVAREGEIEAAGMVSCIC